MMAEEAEPQLDADEKKGAVAVLETFSTMMDWAHRTPKLKWHCTPSVLVGNRQLANNLTKLRELGVTAIVNCGAGKNSFEGWANGCGGTFTYTKIKIEDSPTADLLPLLRESTAFIEENVSKGGVVLVHCMGGFSRSPSVCMAWMIRYRHLRVDEALEVVRVKRSCAQPNQGFMKQLGTWATQSREHEKKK